jgi:DNA-binding NtrC family response regulator
MLRYPWPGNVRELENVIERVLVLSDGAVIPPEELPDHIRRGETDAGSLRDQVLSGRKSLGDAVDEFERELVLEALTRLDFNQTRAAELLGTTRRILKYRMDKLGIQAGPEP